MLSVTTTESAVDRLRHRVVMVRAESAIFRVEGPGAVACLQGLLTNDVDTPGPGSLVYGALLTPKGMIILDLWSLRDAAGFTLIAPLAARPAALELFRRTLPPRMARVTDRTAEWSATWLLGGGIAPPELPELGPLPAPGEVVDRASDGDTVQVAAGTRPAWFRWVITGPVAGVSGVERNLSAAGAVEGGSDDAHIARVLAGWPALGLEIGEKTLPQEVRYDEIGGVSYTKGCYTGQETVARVHFRGHPNRLLRGLSWDSTAQLTDPGVRQEERDVGQITSIVRTERRQFGLAVLRREVGIGQDVGAGGHPARVLDLPFLPDQPAG